MPLLLLKDLPQFECLLKAAERYPSLEPSACHAFLNLLRTGDMVAEAEAEYLAACGVSHGRFTVMMLLNRFPDEPSTPAELADESGVTRATMTGLLDNLEKEGLVARSPSADDRRATLVSLTPKGRAFIDGILPDYFSRVSDIMKPLSEREQHQLVTILQKIQNALYQERTFAPDGAEAHASPSESLK